MRTYDLLIEGATPPALIMTAIDDASAESLMRESLQVDYGGEQDPLVLAMRISLRLRASGQAILEAQLADLLA